MRRCDNKELRAEIVDISTRLDTLCSSVEEVDQYSRVDNLLIHGVQLPAAGQAEDLFTAVSQTINQFMPDVHLTSDVISTVHRLSAPKQSAAPNSSTTVNKPPAIVVRFTHSAVKTSILSQRKLLKGKNITISEHLCAPRVQLLKKATTLVTTHKLQAA